tara:strand:+ start:1542 stop:1718 length:177 start_codon:yes stop_codon:yes gene_type:complete
MRDSFKDLTDKEYAELVWGNSMKSIAFMGVKGKRVYFIKTKWFSRIKQVTKDKYFNYK